jgi:hypothetical protein
MHDGLVTALGYTYTVADTRAIFGSCFVFGLCILAVIIIIKYVYLLLNVRF